MPKFHFKKKEFEMYHSSVLYSTYLFEIYMIKNHLFFNNFQDYLNAFKDFLKSKDYQDSIKDKKGV